MLKTNISGTSLPAKARKHPVLRWSSTLCLVLGIVLLLICGSVWAEGQFVQTYESRELNSEANAYAARARALGNSADQSKPVQGSTPSQQMVKADSLIGKLEISRLGVSVVVLQGVDDHTLRIAAGHIPDTAFPGNQGNVGIAAHRDTFFRALRNIRENDIITIATASNVYRYQVDKISIVEPDRIDVLDPTPNPTLTLVTCFPFYYLGAAPHRFIVRARQIPVGRA